MNNKVIIAVVVILLVAAGLGAGAYFMMKQKPAITTPQTVLQNITPSISPENQVQKKSFKDLMGLADSQKCTFTDTTTQNSGTVYASGGKVRGAFAAQAEGKTIASHMISDGSFIYMWTDGETKGFKTSLEAMQSLETSPQPQQGVDINKQIDFDCSAWSADPSLFTLPTTVKFEDYSQMMKNIKTIPTVSGTVQGENTKSSQCAACDSLPAESQAQCRAALKC